MYKIVLINHIFGQESIRKRWEMLAQQHLDIELTLIGPKEMSYGDSKSLTLGIHKQFVLEEYHKGNYHVIPVALEYSKHGMWISTEMVSVIKKIQPDLLFHIGDHYQDSLMQCFECVRKYVPACKVVVFSMRGPHMNILYKGSKTIRQFLAGLLIYGPRVLKTNKYSDAIFCHYPDAVKCFRKEGYNGPIYIQTQVGVDTDIYKPDVLIRNQIRDKYQMGDSFVFGSASRYAPDKGVDDILDALPKEGNWKYLLMGGGTPEEGDHIREKIKKLGIEDKVIITGTVDQSSMYAYWNAVDCAVHVPRSAKSSVWIETFSLALVQAMATNIPVIGNTSGSVPYQVGPDGIIVDEGDVASLNEKMKWIMNHPEESKIIGDAMRWRAVNCFGIQHLDDCIYDIFMDVIHGVYDKMKFDMASYRVPEK